MDKLCSGEFPSAKLHKGNVFEWGMENDVFYPLSISESLPPKQITGYKFPETSEHLLSWHHVDDKLTHAVHYWINTTHQNKPHSIPLWGIWYNHRILVDGSPQTKWVRYLTKNENVVVHLPSATDVCIIEGNAVLIDDEDLSEEIWDKLDSIYRQKYNVSFGSPYIAVVPRKIIAWDTPTLEHATKWTFS